VFEFYDKEPAKGMIILQGSNLSIPQMQKPANIADFNSKYLANCFLNLRDIFIV